MTDELLTQRTRLRIAGHVRASISSDGLVLLDVNGGAVLASNSIGARIWELLEQRCPCADIARELAREYDVPVADTYRDVVAFVAALAARGLIGGDEGC